MTHHRISRRARGALSAVLAAGVFVPIAAGATPAAAVTPTVTCTSAKAGLAAQLSKDITAALAGRKTTAAVAVHDRTTKTFCTLRGDQRYDSASVVKVTVLMALLWDAQKTNRALTQRESSLATAMITTSDNASTSTLWNQLGLTKIKAFLQAAGMTQTIPGADGYWGLTRITANDEQKLLALLTAKNTVMTDTSRSYTNRLMRSVVTSQRWGVTAGAPANALVGVKNGWLSRTVGNQWRVHSIGTFTGNGHHYTMTVLTHDNPTMNDGVNTIQAVARAINKNLNPTAPASKRYEPTRTPQEAVVPAPES
ncbi:class A beta-lactamase-related serine hydrolase [Streptomyces sp. A3M-1-3]|uniref:serine hydrolase n=1 Tax=Streptomyces sp. A3M-1-3 TaxID=2962044 RepID=UPI0020B8F552|nr:serine hydrolase [Streptomyces sp. A3M-1-3]MCP3819594.1 class A beta-lactamase-related serine hydrolase [Streptomyces sp. A3M-1-3]